MGWRGVVACALTVAAAAAGCTHGGGTLCSPGASSACTCSDGRAGTHVCDGDGAGYSGCTCGGVATCSVSAAGDGTPAVDTCSADDACICPGLTALCASGGSCSNAFTHHWAIGIVSLSLPTTNPATGSAWDPLGGAPDPYVRVSLNGTEIGLTTYVSDTFNATWSPPQIVMTDFHVGDALVLHALDFDTGSGDDPAFDCNVTVTAAVLRGRVVGCSGSLGTLHAVVVPTS